MPQKVPKEPAEGKKKREYWDRDWNMPGMNFIPDKWYIRVAWVVTLIVFTIYANSQLL